MSGRLSANSRPAIPPGPSRSPGTRWSGRSGTPSPTTWVGRNVAALVKAPQGRGGRPSKSFTLEQAKALLAASEHTRLHAYVVLSLLVGIRTEEARALRWDHVVTWVDDPAGWQPVASAGFDPSWAGEERFAIYVWRSEREGRRHQDREGAQDPGATATLRGGAAAAAGTARARPADGRCPLAGARPGLCLQD